MATALMPVILSPKNATAKIGTSGSATVPVTFANSDDTLEISRIVPHDEACHATAVPTSVSTYLAFPFLNDAISPGIVRHCPDASSPTADTADDTMHGYICIRSTHRSVRARITFSKVTSARDRMSAMMAEAASVRTKPTGYLPRGTLLAVSSSEDPTPSSAAEKVSTTTELTMSAVNRCALMRRDVTALKASCVAATSEKVDTGRYSSAYEYMKLSKPIMVPRPA
ncbi:hypothetical protein EJB05_39524, partial [Eragrostis curvula]